MRIGSRLANAAVSDIRAMTRACDAAGGINLGQGVCDLPTPEPVARAAHAAIEAGKAVYAPPEGVPALRQAVAKRVERDYGLSVDPMSEVVVTLGATGGFAAACLALLDPGDEVILFEPYYGYHYNTVVGLGMVPVLVPLRPPTWDVDFDELARAVTPRTRAIVVCTPGNPHGKVWTPSELDALGGLAESRDRVVITDEIYEHIVYEGAKHVPLATRPGMRGRARPATACAA